MFQLGSRLVGVACLGMFLRAAEAAEPPTDWFDPDTGHRVIRIYGQAGSASLYFYKSTDTPEGDRMIFDSPTGIAVADLKSLGQGEPQLQIVVSHVSALAMAWRTREV